MRMPGALENTAEEEYEGFALPPGLIDSCFQLLAVSGVDDESFDTTYIPLGVESLYFYGNSATFTEKSLWCHATERRTESKEALGADIVLFDEDNNIVLRIDNLRLKKATGEALLAITRQKRVRKSQFDDWVYDLDWVDSEAPSAGGSSGTTMIINGDSMDVSQLAAGNSGVTVLVSPGRYAAVQSGSVWNVQADLINDAAELFKDRQWGEIDTLVFAAAAGTSETTALEQLVALTQWLVQHKTFPRLVVVTEQSTPVSGKVKDVSGSTIWGLVRTLAKEVPQFKARIVDIDPESYGKLANELNTDTDETEVAYTNGSRYVSRMKTSGLRYEAEDVVQRLVTTGRQGGIAALELQAASRVEPTEGMVEIRVRVTGLNFRDVMNSLGMFGTDPVYLAMPFGGECAGVVSAVGAGVTQFKVGDEVFGLASGEGAFGTFVNTNENFVVHKPKNLTFEEATTIPATFLTAYIGLVHHAKLKKSERVLIHSATGGVGLAAVQVARSLGCHIIGTAGSQVKRDYLLEHGVHEVYNSRTTDFQSELTAPVDVALNALAGDFIPATLKVLANGGRLIEIGKMGIWTKEEMAEARPDVMYEFFDLVQMWQTDPAFIKSLLGDIMRLLGTGSILPLPVKSFDLVKYADAFRHMQRAKHIGKVVVSHPVPLKDVACGGDNACYIVTGGYGGIGLQTCKWLVKKGARNICVMSRRPEVPEKALEELLATAGDDAGDMRLIAAVGDVANAADVTKAMKQIASLGLTLKGIIHSAGVTNDKPFSQQSWADFTSVMAVKVQGGWNLHEATKDMPLDFFVMYSSVSALLGNVGQANYAAANAYLDGLCQHRRGMGLPALSVAWGPWAEVGMAANMENAAAMGMTSDMMIPTDVGLKLLEAAIRNGVSYAAIVPPAFMHRFAGMTPSPITADMVAALTAKAKKKKNRNNEGSSSEGGDATLLKALTASAPADRRKITSDYLCGEIGRVLSMDASKVASDRDFGDMGFDSLIAIEFRNAVSAAVDFELPSTLIFDHPNVDALTTYILADVVKLSDAPVTDNTSAATTSNKQPFFLVQGIGRGDRVFGELEAFVPNTYRIVELLHANKKYVAIKDLAAQLVVEINSEQPLGAIALGGFSFGGAVAYEVSVQLKESGRDVTHLALMDWVEKSMAEGQDIDVEIMALGALVRSLELLKGKKVPDQDEVALAKLDWKGKFAYTMKLIKDNGLVPASIPDKEFLQSSQDFVLALDALLEYTPSPTVLNDTTNTIAFRAKQGGLHNMTNYDWESVMSVRTTGLAVLEIDTSHWGLLKGAEAALVGTAIATFLTDGVVASNVTAKKSSA
jgi:myxalamid-type polyketide synthase MxaB